LHSSYINSYCIITNNAEQQQSVWSLFQTQIFNLKHWPHFKLLLHYICVCQWNIPYFTVRQMLVQWQYNWMRIQHLNFEFGHDLDSSCLVKSMHDHFLGLNNMSPVHYYKGDQPITINILRWKKQMETKYI